MSGGFLAALRSSDLVDGAVNDVGFVEALSVTPTDGRHDCDEQQLDVYTNVPLCHSPMECMDVCTSHSHAKQSMQLFNSHLLGPSPPSPASTARPPLQSTMSEQCERMNAACFCMLHQDLAQACLSIASTQNV